MLEQGEMIAQGERLEMLNNQDMHALLDFDTSKLPAWPPILDHSPAADPIVELKNAKVSYGDTVIFEGINLRISPAQHTLLTGPNGSGKSTLLQLITGDHPQSYGNDIQVLGYKRGSGDRKSTRLNSSHIPTSYAVFCLKKKNRHIRLYRR